VGETLHPQHDLDIDTRWFIELLADGALLDDHLNAMGGWISSVLVKVGDLRWDFLPPIDPTT
jgi:hypothetical protein